MILSFGNELARDLVEDRTSKATRSFPPDLRRKARMKLALLHSVREIGELNAPPGNRLEKLRGLKAGAYSIRINDQWRITFGFDQGNAFNVMVEDYHT